MVTIACALLGIGYLLTYVAGSNLQHGPGHGVGFIEAMGFGSGPQQSSPPASTQARSSTPGAAPGKPKPGSQGGAK